MLALPTEAPPSPMLLAATLRAAATRGDLASARDVARELAPKLAQLLADDLEAGIAAVGFLGSWTGSRLVRAAVLEAFELTAAAAPTVTRPEAAPVTIGGRRFF